MSNPNAACEHGRQRRKCEICELLLLEKENAALRAEVEDYKWLERKTRDDRGFELGNISAHIATTFPPQRIPTILDCIKELRNRAGKEGKPNADD